MAIVASCGAIETPTSSLRTAFSVLQYHAPMHKLPLLLISLVIYSNITDHETTLFYYWNVSTKLMSCVKQHFSFLHCSKTLLSIALGHVW